MVKRFNWCAHIDSDGTTTYRTLRAQFGDGYVQRIADGINTKQTIWNVKFTNKKTVILAIKTFLDEHAQYKAFEWKPPLEDDFIFVSAGEYKFNSQGTAWTLTTTFTQEYL